MTWSSILLRVWLETPFCTCKTTPKGFQKCENVRTKLQRSLGNQVHKTGHFETSEPVCANSFFVQHKSHSFGLWSCSWTWWNNLFMNMKREKRTQATTHQKGEEKEEIGHGNRWHGVTVPNCWSQKPWKGESSRLEAFEFWFGFGIILWMGNDGNGYKSWYLR